MYKVKYGLAPSIINELFKQKSTSYSLRNSDFNIPTFNTIDYGKHSLRYQRPHIWSKLHKRTLGKKDLTSLLNNNNIAAATFAILGDYLLYNYYFII